MITTKQGRDSKGRFLPTTSPEEARIIELEALLAEEKRLYKLSKMSDANARGLLQQIRDEIGGDQDEPALEKVRRMKDEVISRGVACEWNAAEVVRLAESLRLAEQGRNEALKTIEECRSLMAPYMTGDAKRDPLIRLCSASAVAMSRTQALAKERDALSFELEATAAHLDELSLENTRLEAQVMPEESPLLPFWARIAFAGIGLFILAYCSHRMGFDAAMTLHGGAR